MKGKIRFVTFAISKYGGIIQHIENKFQAFKDLGYDCDIILLDYVKTVSNNNTKNKIKNLEQGVFEKNMNIRSSYKGYSKSETTGYWSNPYFGWLLPETNILPALHKDTVQKFKELTEDVDLIIWSFAPTKNLKFKGFNWWHEFFDLPKTTKQILTIHDGYYDLRNQWSELLKGKVDFMECVHVTSLKACQNFSIPRFLNLDSRVVDENSFDNLTYKKDREFDFLSCHIFKTMKRMQFLVGSVPYIESDKILIGGSGVEQYKMSSEEKVYNQYMVHKKTDPDCEDFDIGKSLWKRAEENGMTFVGQLNKEEMTQFFQNTKFAIDISYSTHYAKYVKTHLNGFIIEAIINGCYPILTDYRDDNVEDDVVFNNLRAIYVSPKDTLKQIGTKISEVLEMSEEKYLEDTYHNLVFAMEYLSSLKNVENIIDVVFHNKKENVLTGQTTTELLSQAKKTMTEFFGYEGLSIFNL